MSIVTKAKINLKEGTIELEGSEAFVTKYLEIFRKHIEEVKFPESIKTAKPVEEHEGEKLRRRKKTPSIITPIPLDLKESDGKPSLRAFYKEKRPQTFEEKLTVFAYYLKTYKNIDTMEAGHVVTCCKEVKSKTPSNINSMFKNIKYRQGWVDFGKKEGTVTITTLGENFVEYDLPREKHAPKDKATA
jgi:hypothetical protein